jgi:hypothetical protein
LDVRGFFFAAISQQRLILEFRAVSVYCHTRVQAGGSAAIRSRLIPLILEREIERCQQYCFGVGDAAAPVKEST